MTDFKMPTASDQKRMTKLFRVRILRCSFLAVLFVLAKSSLAQTAAAAATGAEDRVYSVQVLTRIAEPVLTSLASGTLKKDLPHHEDRKSVV